MTYPLLRSALVATTLGLRLMSAWASVTSFDSLSQSISTAVGSMSESLKESSKSSAKGLNKIAQGDYRVLALAELPERPGVLRVTLQATADGQQDFELYLPRTAAQRGQLVQGAMVAARERPYGTEFVSHTTQKPFYLVMADDWYRQLPNHPVTL